MTRERHHVALPAFQFGALFQVHGNDHVEDVQRNGDIHPFVAAQAVDQDATAAPVDDQTVKPFDSLPAHSKSPHHNHYHTDANSTRIRYPKRVIPSRFEGVSARTLPRAIDSQRIESISTYARRGSAGVRSGSSVFTSCSSLPRLARGGESRDENNSGRAA